MPPILHLLRHGQGYHSEKVTENGHLLRDPHLTEEGKAQCRRRCEAFSRHDEVDLLLASPLRRAIQTCQIVCAPAVRRGLRVTLLPIAEEVSADPADTGSAPAVLRAEFDDGSVDFAALTDDGWYRHQGEFATDARAVMARAVKLRRWIRARAEREIVLVSHGFYNHFITGEVDENGEQTTGWWEEAEMRTYTFAEGDEELASLLETQESLAARGAKSADAKGKAEGAK